MLPFPSPLEQAGMNREGGSIRKRDKGISPPPNSGEVGHRQGQNGERGGSTSDDKKRRTELRKSLKRERRRGLTSAIVQSFSFSLGWKKRKREKIRENDNRSLLANFHFCVSRFMIVFLPCSLVPLFSACPVKGQQSEKNRDECPTTIFNYLTTTRRVLTVLNRVVTE